MYIVREKATGKIVHFNPAPLSQGLKGTDVYFQFDPETMEIGQSDLPDLPEHFDLDEHGGIVPWTLERRVKAGVATLPPELKAVGDQVVEKTIPEKVADGVIKLRPTEKLQGDQIVSKTIAEQVAEGIIKLTPTQVLDGQNVREMTDGEKAAAGMIKLDPWLKVIGGQRVVPKTRAEQARDKLIQLDPDEKLVGDQIVKLTQRQMLDEKRITLDQYRQSVLDVHTQDSLDARRKVVPDHELLYAALGALDPARVAQIRNTVSGFVRDLDQVKDSVQKAKSADELDAIPRRKIPVGPPIGISAAAAEVALPPLKSGK